MPRKIFLKWFCAWGRVTPTFVLLLLARRAEANPTGLTVVSGAATAVAAGSQLNITASQNAVLDWTSFNIAGGERTIFNQPSSTSVVFNRITDQNPTQIYGSLQANGVVVLLNSSGFYFGPNSFVSAAGLTVSTANFVPPQNAGGAWIFNGPPPLASIVNFGQIKIGHGGDCFFIADKIENHGTVEADGGNIQFAAGQTVTLSERPDGRGMSMAVTLPQGSVDNYGNVIADGGTIAMHAKVVNQDGLVQANSVQNVNGVIELFASDSLSLGADSKISARGDDAVAVSAGGTVTLKSDNNFSDATGSQIVTSGGVTGGNGGNVEISAPNIQSLNSAMDAGAQGSFTGGEFLLDPASIMLGGGGSGTVPNSGTVAYNTPGVLRLNVNTAFANKNFSNIKLQASGDITLDAGTTWDLSGSTGNASGLVTLQAGGNIFLNDGAAIVDSQHWGLTLQAGYNFVGSKVTPGVGSITFDGASYLQLAAGGINLTAGQDITVNYGFVITTGGGGIGAHALSGSLFTGVNAQGYVFNKNAPSIGAAYNLSGGLGGISTAAGGNVTLIAGTDVGSYLPAKSDTGAALTAGAGAYGPQGGDVTVIAGGNVTGHYLVANGIGSIFAGVLMDANKNPISVGGKYSLGSTGSAGLDLSGDALALSLIKGGWNVTAASKINLQEIRNPNGLFNNFVGSPLAHYFDYSPTDFVNLSAGDQVQLGGNQSPRPGRVNVPMIYPGILNIAAGAGGVVLNSLTGPVGTTYGQLILFPSPLGSLIITTTAGGSLTRSPSNLGTTPLPFSIIISDSSSVQYDIGTGGTFGTDDHATTPIHLGSEQPVQLNISGNLNLVRLYSPEAAQINVVGNINNSRFQGMNLSAADITSITVGQAAKVNLENANLLNPATDGGLIVGGDIINNVNYGAAGQLDPTGYVIGGGGLFQLTARNIDLGTTAGIISAGVGLYNNSGYYPLAQLFNTGSKILINASGNLSLFSTSIASFNGGDIYLNADGNVFAGSALFTVQTFGARGIFSTGVGNVAVYAGGDISIEGSRIAVYDTRPLLSGTPAPGGSLTVVSRHGNITVGGGGSGYVTVFSYFVDPVTHGVTSQNPTIPGTGILQTSFNRDGNVLVEALDGSITVGVGGIKQVLFKGNQLEVNEDQLATLFRLALEGNTAAAKAYQDLINGAVTGAPVSYVDVFAGYSLETLDANQHPVLDSFGNPLISAVNLTAGTLQTFGDGKTVDAHDGAGVVSAGNLTVKATGDVLGNFASIGGDASIAAQHDIIGNIYATGTAAVASDSGKVEGKVIGIVGVSASGSEVTADLQSNGSISGDTAGTAGFTASATAGNAAAGVGNEESAKAAKQTDEKPDEEANKKKKPIALAQKVSRVTVLLPKRN